MHAILFDLDGTLIDSAPDIHAAVNAMLAEEGRAPLSLPEVIAFIGNGLPRLVELVIAARDLDRADHQTLTAQVLEYYNAMGHSLTRLYPGVRPALEALRARGHWLGLCTNKPEAPARHILDQFDLAPFFSGVIGGDSLPQRKPDPAPLQALIDQAGASAIYVGDSEVDAQTAQRAGVPFLLFTEGYRKGPVEALPHHARFAQFDALTGLIDDISR